MCWPVHVCAHADYCRAQHACASLPWHQGYNEHTQAPANQCPLCYERLAPPAQINKSFQHASHSRPRASLPAISSISHSLHRHCSFSHRQLRSLDTQQLMHLRCTLFNAHPTTLLDLVAFPSFRASSLYAMRSRIDNAEVFRLRCDVRSCRSWTL